MVSVAPRRKGSVLEAGRVSSSRSGALGYVGLGGASGHVPLVGTRLPGSLGINNKGWRLGYPAIQQL